VTEGERGQSAALKQACGRIGEHGRRGRSNPSP